MKTPSFPSNCVRNIDSAEGLVRTARWKVAYASVHGQLQRDSRTGPISAVSSDVLAGPLSMVYVGSRFHASHPGFCNFARMSELIVF